MSMQAERAQTLTKSDMVLYLMDNLALTRQESRLFVEQFFQEIANCLIAGYHVKLSGFGNFELKQKRQRPGRNPKTGEVVRVSARRVVTFRAGQKLRRCVEEALRQP